MYAQPNNSIAFSECDDCEGCQEYHHSCLLSMTLCRLGVSHHSVDDITIGELPIGLLTWLGISVCRCVAGWGFIHMVALMAGNFPCVNSPPSHFDTQNVCRSHIMYPLMSSNINQSLNLLINFSKTTQFKFLFHHY
jgi:hypothetical protein